MLTSTSKRSVKTSWQLLLKGLEQPNNCKNFAISFEAFEFLFNDSETYITCSHACTLIKIDDLKPNQECPRGEKFKSKNSGKQQMVVLFDVLDHVQYLYNHPEYAQKMTYHKSVSLSNEKIYDTTEAFRYRERTKNLPDRDVFYMATQDAYVFAFLV